MQRFYAILTQPVLGQPVGTLVNVTAGVDDFAGLWLVLEPPDLAGQRLVPLLDADRAITLKEAAHILGMRRGQSRAMKWPQRATVVHLQGGDDEDALPPQERCPNREQVCSTQKEGTERRRE